MSATRLPGVFSCPPLAECVSSSRLAALFYLTICLRLLIHSCDTLQGRVRHEGELRSAPNPAHTSCTSGACLCRPWHKISIAWIMQIHNHNLNVQTGIAAVNSLTLWNRKGSAEAEFEWFSVDEFNSLDNSLAIQSKQGTVNPQRFLYRLDIGVAEL